MVKIPARRKEFPPLGNVWVKKFRQQRSWQFAFWHILDNHIHGGELYAIKLYESDNNLIEYRGE